MDTLKVKKIDDFKLDARYDKKVWNDASELVLVDSGSGKEVEKKARVKLAWSDTGLYVLYVVEDNHIWGTITKDDEPIYDEEVVEIFIGKGESTPTDYFEFQFSPKSVKFDAKIKNPTGNRKDEGFEVDVAWNAENMKFFQKIEEKGIVDEKCKKGIWITEVFIPWEDMGWEVLAGDKFRANIFRIDGYPEQDSFQSWQPTQEMPPNFHVPEKFGLLIFV